MPTTKLNIAERFDQMEQRFDQIEALINQLLHPAQSMDTKAKAKAIIDALNTGDRKHYRNVLKQINGEH